MGQKRKRTTKTPPKDFVETKHRVGQKKRQPENQTRAVVRVKPVVVGDQTNITKFGSKGNFVTSKNLTLEEVMAQTNHHNVNSRREAYVGIRELLDKFPSAFTPQLGYILSTLAKSLSDSDETIRKHHRAVVERVLLLLGQSEDVPKNVASSQSSPKKNSSAERLMPFSDRLGFQLRSCMTHRDATVRSDGLSFVELLLGHHSVDEMLMTRIVQSCVNGSGSGVTTSTLFQTTAIFIGDLFNKCLSHKAESRHMSQLFRVGRVALRLIQLPTQQTLPPDQSTSNDQQPLSSLISPLLGSGVQTRCKSSPLPSPDTDPVVHLLTCLIDLWAQLSSDKPNSDKRKISPVNENVLRQVIRDFGSGVENKRVAFTPSDEQILIPLAIRLDILNLILKCLIMTPNDKESLSLSPRTGQSPVGSRLLNEILIPGLKSFICPSGVNRKVFYSINRQLSLYLIQTSAVFLASVGEVNDLPTPQTSAVLLSVFSQSILHLPELLNRPTSPVSQKHLQLFLSSLCSIVKTALCLTNATTLLSRSIKSLGTISGTSVRVKDSSDGSPDALNSASLVRWQRTLDSALHKIGGQRVKDQIGFHRRSRLATGFGVLMRKSEETSCGEDSATDSSGDEKNGRNILVQLRSRMNVRPSDVEKCLQSQLQELFDLLWDALGPCEIESEIMTDESQSDDDENVEPFSAVDSQFSDESQLPADEDVSSSAQSQCVDDSTLMSSPNSSPNSSKATPSGFISQKKRKLSAQGDYELILSNPNTSNPSCSTPPNQSFKNPIQKSTTRRLENTDFRICLVPFFGAFVGLPMNESVEFESDHQSMNSLQWTLRQVKESFDSTSLCSLSPSVLKNGNWVDQWIDLAASLSHSNSRSSCFLLNALLSFAQQLTRLRAISPCQNELISERRRSLIQRLIISFNSRLQNSSKNVQKLVVLLTAELSDEDSIDESLTCMLLSSPNSSSPNTSSPNSSSPNSSSDFAIPDDLMSMYIDLILSSQSISVSSRIAFAKSVMSQVSQNRSFVVECCRAHNDRLRLDVDQHFISQNGFTTTTPIFA